MILRWITSADYQASIIFWEEGGSIVAGLNPDPAATGSNHGSRVYFSENNSDVAALIYSSLLMQLAVKRSIKFIWTHAVLASGKLVQQKSFYY